MRRRNPLEAIARARDEAMAERARQATAVTAPDHTPYLAATDLRTPEDVFVWMTYLERDIVTQPYRECYGHDLVSALRSRLDRERRQACRRGALEACRQMMSVVVNGETCSHGWDTGLDMYDGGVEYASQYLTEALAFRAAARAK